VSHARRAPAIFGLPGRTFPGPRTQRGGEQSYRTSSISLYALLTRPPRVKEVGNHQGQPAVDSRPKTIMDSPNLVELSMGIGSLGYVIYEVDPKFARLKGKPFPPLEKLTLEAFSLTAKNVAYWMENMDWSQMRILDLRAIDEPTHFFNEAVKLVGGLPRLKALRLELPLFREARDMREFEDTFRRFLDVPRETGLSEVALEGDYRPYLQTTLGAQGATLKKLWLHDLERLCEPRRCSSSRSFAISANGHPISRILCLT
jgi:hypothetical protein